MPILPAVSRAEQRRVFDARVYGIRICQRRLQMPDALEFPGMRRAVVPLVSASDALVDEFIPDRRPGLAGIVGALDDLSEPTAGLRCVDAIRIGRRALHVVNLPARKMRTADVPLLPLSIRRQDERSFARPD